jgi:hypothetical protein
MEGLVRQLNRWRTVEQVLRLGWGAARFLAAVVAVVFVCCLVDWLVDRDRETPFALRVGLLVVSISAAVFFAWRFLVRLNTPSVIHLASTAEASIPEFDHRIVTALQLNHPEARIGGMSPELIRAVTVEAEAIAARHSFVSLAEYWRLKAAVAVLLPLSILVGGLFLLNGPLVRTMLARHGLADVEIPRSISLEPDTAELWPAGDEVPVRFRVTGEWHESAVGRVRVKPNGQPTETYPLAFVSHDADGAAIFAARVPPSTQPFTYRGWLQDARSRGEGSVRFEPRPVVDSIAALAFLPDFVGQSPSGKRYANFMPQGEIVAFAGARVRIAATASKPLQAATVVVSGRDDSGKETDVLRVPMQFLQEDGVEATFALPPKPTAYRIEVTDRNGFANAFPPRRGIAIAADEPPRVQLLAEVLKDPKDPGPLDDYDVTGMPLVLGGQVQIGYAARSPLGLRKAQIQYRVNEGDWTTLPLSVTVADKIKLGAFVPELGVFEGSGAFGVVEFFQIPARDAEESPDGLEGGGRFNFQTSTLTKKGPDGQTKKLDLGDRVEFYVELFDRNPAEGRAAGRSESRIKTVVSPAQLDEWNRQRVQTAERLRMLEERQRGLFRRGSP